MNDGASIINMEEIFAMDSSQIKEKCRTVFIPLADKRIFTSGRHDNQEFEFVSVFRKEADATRTLDSRRQQRAFDKPEKNACAAQHRSVLPRSCQAD